MGVETALIAGGTQLVSGALGAKGAKKAGRQEVAGRNAAMGQMNSALDYFKELQTPYQQAGMQALNPLTQAVLGQDNYRDPLLDRVQDQVSQQVLQNAALEGRYGAGDMPGLMASALVAPEMQMRQQRIQNLSGLAGMGMQAGGQLGQAGLGVAQANAGQMTGIGQAQANSTLGQYGAMQNAVSGIGSAFSSGLGMGGATPFQFSNPLAMSNPYSMTTPGTSGIPNFLVPRG